jgi:hypothetical protein
MKRLPHRQTSAARSISGSVQPGHGLCGILDGSSAIFYALAYKRLPLRSGQGDMKAKHNSDGGRHD